jgi:ABC-type transport system involved in multi-copper enzyme maturation permease subunit
MALGLLYLWAFVGFYKEVPVQGLLTFLKDWPDPGRLVACAFGGVGLGFGLVALGRSLFPPLFAALNWTPPVASRYVMPSGLLLMGCGLVYFLLALGILSERPFVVMTRRELGAFFHSPVAYFMLLLFTVVAFFQFMLFVFQLLWDISSWAPAPAVPEPIIRPYIFSLVSVFCLVFLVPVLTMHLVSEEKRTGTLEMTLTAPQDEGTVVFSKFTAALFMFLLTWAPWGFFLWSLRWEGGKPFDYLPLLAWFLILVVSGAGFISMGLFFSSLTRNQLMAAVMTFVGMLLFVAFFLIKEYLLSRGTLWRDVMGRISFVDVWLNSLEGKLGITDLIYHLSVTVFWLFLTVKVLESRKWR